MMNAPLSKPERARSYRTTDGRLFEDRDDADRHQAALNLVTYCRQHGIEPGDFADDATMAVHGRAFAEILAPFRRRRGNA